MENPNHGVTVDDPLTGQGVVLRWVRAQVVINNHVLLTNFQNLFEF